MGVAKRVRSQEQREPKPSATNSSSPDCAPREGAEVPQGTNASATTKERIGSFFHFQCPYRTGQYSLFYLFVKNKKRPWISPRSHGLDQEEAFAAARISLPLRSATVGGGRFDAAASSRMSRLKATVSLAWAFIHSSRYLGGEPLRSASTFRSPPPLTTGGDRQRIPRSWSMAG